MTRTPPLFPASPHPRIPVSHDSRVAAIFLVLFLLSSSVCFPFGDRSKPPDQEPVGLPPSLQDVGIDQKLNAQIPLDLVFRDESGHDRKLAEYFAGKPVVLVLAYYECPMLCTYVLNGTVSALKVLTFDAGKEFQVVVVSFDPHDTPSLAAAKKANYVKTYGRNGAASGWHFLTGEQESIHRLTEAVGFRYRYDEKDKQFAHASAIMVATPKGRLSRYFYGVEYSPRDLKLALMESAEGRIGSPVDHFLLFCYEYDPAKGKYGAAVINLVRLGGVLTVAAMGIFFVQMKRKERNGSSHA